MTCLPKPKVVATTIIMKKMKGPKKKVFNGDNKGKTQLDAHGRAMKGPR